MSVQVKQLTKKFKGQTAVKNISFDAGKNEILGFLGPNGAGKSTTMKIITCFLPPTEGTVSVNEQDVTTESLEIKKIIGYLPENNPLYLDMYVHEYLRFITKLNGFDGKLMKKKVADMIDICGLTREQNKLIGSLSKGYRQRVGLAQTLIHDPEILILDEPTTGLDPNQISEVRNLIKDISKEKTVILSTHIMQEVQALCDKVVIINEGEIVADGKLEDLQSGNSKGQRVRIRLSSAIPREEFLKIKEVEEVTFSKESDAILIISKPGSDVRAAINKFAVEKGVNLLELSVVEDSLEDIFRQLTQPGR